MKNANKTVTILDLIRTAWTPKGNAVLEKLLEKFENGLNKKQKHEIR